MSMDQRVTQKSIAQECGVSTATVSYALRNSARIPQATRDRILAVAKKLGYQPDPGLASLGAQRSTRGNAPFTASVAILHPNAKDSRPSQLFEFHSRHFKSKMQEFGCSVTDFYVDSDIYRPERIAQILHTRGIKGILLGWGAWPDYFRRFPWNEFAVISTERTDLGTGIDKVGMNQFHALDDIFKRLEPLPESRYGLMLHDDCPDSTAGHILGAYYANLYEHPSLEKLPPFRYRLGESPDRLRQWFQENQPEVIICHRLIPLDIFTNAGISIPDKTRLVALEVDEDSTLRYSGIHSGSEMGRTIAITLARKIRNNEVNARLRKAKQIFVNGIWADGETLGPL